MEEEKKNIREEEVKEEKKESLGKKISNKKNKINKEKDELIKANLELKEKVLRISAEMQNMKKRNDEALASMYKYEGFDFINKILPVLDNFERAMMVKQEGMEKFLDGFKMIYDNLVSILNNQGIKEIDAKDKEFNPSIMNAVLTDNDNTKEANIVLEVLQKGYMYNDRLLRPAMVKVNERNEE